MKGSSRPQRGLKTPRPHPVLASELNSQALSDGGRFAVLQVGTSPQLRFLYVKQAGNKRLCLDQLCATWEGRQLVFVLRGHQGAVWV